MSIVVTTDVFCDICGNWVFGATGPRKYARLARWRAKKVRWVRQLHNGRMRDVCPICQKIEKKP